MPDESFEELKAKLLAHVNRHKNGDSKPPEPPAKTYQWETVLGYAVKRVLDKVPESGRPAIASMDKDALVEQVINETRQSLTAPVWREIRETDLEEQLQKYAESAATEFQRIYAYADVPAERPVGELDRSAIDGYEAYERMKADRREHSWDGLVRMGCTMVLTALQGAGKTTLAMNVARGWGMGVDVLGRLCHKSKTLVVVSPKEYEAWAETVYFWQLRGMVYLISSHLTHFPSGSDQAHWFEAEMKRLGCETFIFDTLFDFYGLPPNVHGDSNRIAMNEQVPLLETVRTNGWSGIVTGHSPKSEAQALVSRDPEESFAGHTAWTAQHRMRAVIRRKAQGVNAFVTGRGGYGDRGVLKEEMLLFDEITRLVSLGGSFAQYLGQSALPTIVAALENGGGWMGRSDLVNATGKGKNWVHAGIKEGLKQGQVKWDGRGSRNSKYALPDEPDEPLQGHLV